MDVPLKQSCLDHHASAGHWVGRPITIPGTDRSSLEQRWESTSTTTCAWSAFDTAQARSALRGQHVMVVGDLHARLFYAALIYLVNGTASPEDVAPGLMRHRPVAPCAWNAAKQARAWYDWAGWGEFPKDHKCHVTAYGWPNLYNVTLPTATSWWGRGDARDVMTMLQKDNPRYHHYTHEGANITFSYVWRSVIRTGGSGLHGAYTRQHPRVMSKVQSLIGRGPPSLIVSGMYAFDAQWQGPPEMGIRLRGLFRGLNEHFASALKLSLGPSSCPAGKQYSEYMGQRTRHNMFHGVENASALAPEARLAALNQSILHLDTRPSKLRFPPTKQLPCHYDLPLGPMSEALVQIALNALFPIARPIASAGETNR